MLNFYLLNSGYTGLSSWKGLLHNKKCPVLLFVLVQCFSLFLSNWLTKLLCSNTMYYAIACSNKWPDILERLSSLSLS